MGEKGTENYEKAHTQAGAINFRGQDLRCEHIKSPNKAESSQFDFSHPCVKLRVNKTSRGLKFVIRKDKN